jgi:hypothetical protein
MAFEHAFVSLSTINHHRVRYFLNKSKYEVMLMQIKKQRVGPDQLQGRETSESQ